MQKTDCAAVGRNRAAPSAFFTRHNNKRETAVGFGRGLLLWLIGIPLPIIILIALFMHH
jgi:hypothetical protein